GVSLDDIQLQGGSIVGAFVWRAKPPPVKNAAWALIEDLELEPKYEGGSCPADKSPCVWSQEAVDELASVIEKDLPTWWTTNMKLRRIKPLLGVLEDDYGSTEAWGTLSKALSHSREKLVETLIGIGCAADTNPFVVRGLIEQLDDRFGNTPIKLLMHL